jgi:hypothetical protein
MQTQKIITIAIVLLIILLLGFVGVGVWVRMQTTPLSGTGGPSGGTTTEPNNQPGGNGNTVPGGNTTTPGGTGGTTGGNTSAGTIPNSQTEYTKLFSTLGASKITLQIVGTTAGQYGDVYALYAADVELAKKVVPNATGYPIYVGVKDLNTDSTSEVVVYKDMPGLCGSGGCQIEVLQKKGSSYEALLSTVGYEFIGAGSTKTNGYTDLYISVHGSDAGYMTEVVKYAWNGTMYAPTSAVAVWDGDSFEVKK